MYMKYSKEIIEQVCALYAHNSTGLVAQMCNLTRHQVIYIVHKYAQLRTLQESKNMQKNKVNDYFFSVINTEEKAYWLGFLYADGSVSKSRNIISLVLQKSDIEHLQKYKKSLNISSNVRIRTIKFHNQLKYSCGIHFSSLQMKTDLIRLGCVPNKSLILKFPSENIFSNPELIRHFIRGYFDGDGSVFISREKHWRNKRYFNVIHYRFCGTYDFLQQVDKYINLKGTFYKTNSIYELCYKRKKKLIPFYKFLYKDATIFLERKKQIFEKYIEEECSETIISQLHELKVQSSQD